MLQYATITKNLLQKTPTIFTKYGDGELLCINGAPGRNSDGHPYSPELGKRLNNAYHHFWTADPNTFIGRQATNEFGRDALETECEQQHGTRTSQTTNYELLLPNALDPELIILYMIVKGLPIPKVFVGPQRLAGAAEMLRCTHITIPLTNCFSDYDRVLAELCQRRSTLVLYSASMMSRCLIHEHRTRFPASTHLDIGSGFDGLFVGHTRHGQPTTEQCRQFFKTLL